MMFIGVVIFLVGLFLVIDCKGQVSQSLSKSLFNKDDKTLGILRERFARGEISGEEYKAMKNVLENNN
ncbi:SHOCT domain-containing protein [Dehalobacter sp. TeCB1]|uniref:SHOCT domain-containing protein n=1 Tax=Dehalobacter sp. TeCB1 TaxID=1843715 RepID=UPI00083B95AD|nr:SHOCT domain-containing protein [Dehalobacter sp. TeCB1]OCZ49836.1 hypothetical protein A7D23_00360 [Dehalobacter sp. TeCB1]